jgi:hypothetical protein
MEIKAELIKPYSEDQRIDFIIEQNYNNGYEIKETAISLQAWGYTVRELEQQEKERKAKLSLTKREVFLGLYQAKGVTPEMIKAQITDPMALIEFEYANDYFRGNPLINTVGCALGITPKQLDAFFEDGNYKHLLEV